MRKLIFGLMIILGMGKISAQTETNLPWQSMPEIFNKKNAKEAAREKTKLEWQEQQIEQLREDNRELMIRLQESLMQRQELNETKEGLSSNLDLELKKTAELQIALQKALENEERNQQVLRELNQCRENFHNQEERYKADLQKQKKETQILAEALVASRKQIKELKNQQHLAVQLRETPLKQMIALGEDFDLNEIDKSPKKADESVSKGDDDILFTSLDSIVDEQSGQDIAYVDDYERMTPIDDIERSSEMVFVTYASPDRPGFYISTHKVTNQEYESFVRGINYKRPIHWEKGQIPEGMENAPVVNISYEDAFLYSVWLGKRLPSEDELARALEVGGIIIDTSDDTSEWTATPEIRKSTHRIFSACNTRQDRFLPNQAYNGNTGFRVASDSN